MKGNVIRLLEKHKVPHQPLERVYDVLVIGAGVVGCAIARRFSQTGLAVAVIDKASDVGEGGASKSNSAIAHSGFDADPGSLEAKLVCKASREWPSLASHLKIPFLQVGALMIARDATDYKALQKYHQTAIKNGVDDVQLLSGEEARAMEPHAFEGEQLYAGLHIPRESVVDPFAVCDAFAETALIQGGCNFFLQAEVDAIVQESSGKVRVKATRQGLDLVGRNVINSAGIGSQSLATLYGGESFILNPRRGQFLVYDSLARNILNKILLPVPNHLGKGILVTPTVFGNLLAGPTAEDMSMEELSQATQTTLEGLNLVKNNITKALPKLAQFKPIAHYAGARTNCKEGLYLFKYGEGEGKNIVTLAGIRSTGLSASFAIAEEVFNNMVKRGMINPKYEFRCSGRSNYPPWVQHALWKDEKKVKRNRNTVCFCENVDREHIIQAVHSPLSPNTTDAIKRRTRATTGRCQGFNCLVDVCKIVASEGSRQVRTVSKRGPGTEWFPNFVDTSPTLHQIHSKFASSDLFNKTELYNKSSNAWYEDEKFQVIVVGAGPAGCGTVLGLIPSIKIQKVLLLERSARVGGIPAQYPINDESKVKTYVHFTKLKMVSGYDFAEELRSNIFGSIFGYKLSLKLKTNVMEINQLASDLFRVVCHDGSTFISNCVVVATGARESNSVEKRFVTGHRTSGILYSNHLLSTGGGDSFKSNVSIGSGLVPRSILYKSDVTFVKTKNDESPKLAKYYFSGGTEIDNCDEFRVFGPEGKADHVDMTMQDKTRAAGRKWNAVILGGSLVANDEILKRSTFTQSTDRVITAGNVQESTLGPWPGVACYLHAKSFVARKILAKL